MKFHQIIMKCTVALLTLIICASISPCGFLANANSYYLEEGSVIELGKALVTESHQYSLLELIQRDELYKADILEEDAAITQIYSNDGERDWLLYYINRSGTNKPDLGIDIFQGATAVHLDAHDNGVQKDIWDILNPDGSFVSVCVWELGGTKSSICITRIEDEEIMDILLPYTESAYNSIYSAIQFFIDKGFIDAYGK